MASVSTRRAGNGTSAPSDGSRTITVHDSQPGVDPADGARDPNAGPSAAVVGSLRLRGVARDRRRVAWSDETVDNEGMGKKKSKSTSVDAPSVARSVSLTDRDGTVCCIYHKPRAFDESSSEESSSDDDSGPDDDGRARPSNLNSGRRRHHVHHDDCHDAHSHGGQGGEGTRDADGGGSTVVHELDGEQEPNAYERHPKGGKGKGKASS